MAVRLARIFEIFGETVGDHRSIHARNRSALMTRRAHSASIIGPGQVAFTRAWVMRPGWSSGENPVAASDRGRGVMPLFPWLPGLQALRSYRREWLAKDVIAGVVLTTLLVPQGMAYAELAGLPPITGLYTSVMCLLGYAVFGPSRILVLGPDSSLGPMIAATILPLMAAQGDAKRAVALASILAIMVAAIMILAAVAKVGFIADLISKPTMIGYMNGLALTILIGQLPKLFGFKVEADGLIGEIAGFAKGLANGEVVAAAAAVGIAGVVLILVLQRWLPKVPAVLIAVVLAIAA